LAIAKPSDGHVFCVRYLPPVLCAASGGSDAEESDLSVSGLGLVLRDLFLVLLMD
jgi:hypothetical protein